MNISAIKIETILAERRMTKTDLSKLCGISRQNISTIMKRGTCSPLSVGKLADGLGVNVMDILLVDSQAVASHSGNISASGVRPTA